MRFGFNPRIEATTKRDMVQRLLAALEAAEELGFDVIELTLTERMYELGLRTVFGGELLDLMQAARQRFHLHLFPADERTRDPGISDPSPYPRSLQLRRLIQVIEFFEA